MQARVNRLIYHRRAKGSKVSELTEGSTAEVCRWKNHEYCDAAQRHYGMACLTKITHGFESMDVELICSLFLVSSPCILVTMPERIRYRVVGI
jgi:hypothetical protein